MPFSSPTAEEVLSPTLSNLPYNSPQPRRKNRDDRAGKENTHSRKKTSAQKPLKREPSRRHERNQNKSRWPGLNVVTNFSRSPILAHRAADAATQHNRKKELRAQNAKPGFVTLSDIKPPIDNRGDRGFKTHRRNKSSGGTLRSDLELRNHDEKQEKSTYDPHEEATGLGLQHYGDPPDYDACLLSDSKDRLNGLKPSPTKITELSPSDRPIVIGISIPSAKLAEHSISPEVGPTPLTPHGYFTHRDAPETPTIIVTPARDDEPWSAAFGERNEASSSRRRVASSIYSRATYHGQGWTPRTDIPPVPVRPQEYVSTKHGNSKNLPDDQVRIGLGPRADSNDTIFDEDNQVAASNVNGATSRGSQFQILEPSRINTTDRKHSSQGWWNYVLSPFTARSNTMMFRGGSPRSAGSIPTLSSPKSETATPHEQHAQRLARFSSPSIESVGTRNGRTSLRTDHSRFENERHHIGLAFDHTPSIGGPSVFGSPTSFDGFGAAAEYFNACWHDENSPTPYFECQNHSCLPSTRGNFPAPDDPTKDMEDPEVDRGLSNTENNGQASDGFHQTPATRFSAAFSHANRSKPRPLSEATDIEDLDETPVVREARHAPVVHAGAPIKAASVAGPPTNASPKASSSANAPTTTILNTITLNNYYSHAALTKDGVSPSAGQLAWLGSINQLPVSNVASEQPPGIVGSEQPRGIAGSEQPRGIVGSEQPRGIVGSEQPRGIAGSEQSRGMVGSPQPSQPAMSVAGSQRAHKKFVAVMPPDQVSSTREAPISSKPSVSSEHPFPVHSPSSGSPSSSSQMPSNYGASGPPPLLDSSANSGYLASSSPAHSGHIAPRPPPSNGPPINSRFLESSNTVPSGYAISEAPPTSTYANSRGQLPSEPLSSSGVPERSNFTTTEVPLFTALANSKLLPPFNPAMSPKNASSRSVTSPEQPMTFGDANSRPSLPFDASMSSQPSHPYQPPLSSRPPLSSQTSFSPQPTFSSHYPLSTQLPTSSHPGLSSPAPLPPQPPPTSQPSFSHYTPPEFLPPSGYTHSGAPPSESPMSSGYTNSRTLLSNYTASRAPPPGHSMSSEPLISSEHTAPMSSTNLTSRAPPSAEPAIPSQPLMSSHVATPDPLASSQAATSTLPISSRPPLASRYMASREPISNDPIASRYMASRAPASNESMPSPHMASREPASNESMASEHPLYSDYMTTGPGLSSKLSTSSGPPVSFRQTSEPQPSNNTGYKVPPSVEPTSSEPPFPFHYTGSKAPPSIEPKISEPQFPSNYTGSKPPPSVEPTSSEPLFPSSHTASDVPPSSAALSSSRDMAARNMTTRDMGPRDMASETQPMTSRTQPAVKLMPYEPPFASSVPPSTGPPLLSLDTASRHETSELPRSSDYTMSRKLPLYEPPTSSEPSALPGPQYFEDGSSASQVRKFPRKAVPRNGDLEVQTNSVPHTYVVNNYYDGSGPTRKSEQTQLEVIDLRLDASRKSENRWEIREKTAHRSRKRKAGCCPSGKCFKRDKKPKRPMAKKKKKLLWGIAVSLIILIILILALVMTLTRKGDKLNVQSQWLNITGFPPMPTGISTIIQPDAVHESSSCVQPSTLWSCVVPKEDQQSIAPNNPDQPNFRVEIRFQNGTTNNSSNTRNSSKRSQVPALNPISASTFIRRRLLHVRDAFTSNLFSPTPSPPSDEDQIFLGNSTDKITAPFNGESTPFFMSFLSASRLPQRRLVKRKIPQSGNSQDQFPNVTQGIPPPDINSDGTAAPANLLPFPTAQPLRLYDRGLLTEHYGFYNYFDRSIFLKSTSLLNDSSSLGNVPDDENGGSEQSSATVRCTWRQTRFLVQIWTNQGGTSPLLGAANHTASEKNKSPPKNLTESTANDFLRPGSFPYPVTITLDRHGGDQDQKFIYCYGMDGRGHIIPKEKTIELEDRGSDGGVLVNPTGGVFGAHVKVTKKEGGPGGVDGGTGGCGCQWSNFASV